MSLPPSPPQTPVAVHTPVAALADVATAHQPVDGPGSQVSRSPADRAAAQESFAADLFAGVHRDGVAGTVLVVTGTADLQRRRHEVAAVCELARELIAAGHGVRVTDTADPAFSGDRSAASRSALLASTVAVVATTAALDPAVVPAHVPVIGWVLDHTPRWLVNTRLTLFDSLVGGSSVVLARLRAALGRDASSVIDLRVACPRADPTTFLRSPSGAGTQRDLVTVIAGRPLGSFAIPLGRVAGTGRLRIHAPLASVPPALRAYRREPLRAVDRPAAFADSIAVVFCDPEPTEVGDGVVGVAISEAAASGAVPLVRARVGLTEAALGDALGFASPSSLGAALNGLLADVGATRARGARLAAAVARREPLDVVPSRAAGPPGTAAPPGTTRPRPVATVGFFPDLRVTNPYQDMLYAGLGAAGIRVAPVEDALTDAVLRDGGGRLDGYVFHLHWTSAIAQDGKNIFDAADRLARFRARVHDLRSRGGKLVWTIHNALPHELRYRNLELELCRFLAAEADLIHIMSAETVAATAPHYALPADRTVLVPHSSYLGWYPDLLPRAEARRRLGLLPHEIALLALGGIRPYRGLDRLLEVFETLSAGDVRLRLLVAGRPGPGAATQELVRRCTEHPRVTVQFRHLPPSALQVWSRAADLAVLPYRAILNSGAFQLAQSFDLPVVAPRDGSLRGLLDPACTVGFDPADPVDLARAVGAGIALATDPERAAAAAVAARAAATRYPPAAMAADFARALRGLVT